MMRLKEAAGRRLVARDTAEEIGRVKRYLVDPPTARITAIQVDGAPDDRRLVDWEALTGFGPDAVMVPGPDALRAPRGDREQAFLDGRFDLDGKLVLTDRGDAVGSLQDGEFDEASGKLERLELSGGRSVHVDRLVAIGPYAVILPA